MIVIINGQGHVSTITTFLNGFVIADLLRLSLTRTPIILTNSFQLDLETIIANDLCRHSYILGVS